MDSWYSERCRKSRAGIDMDSWYSERCGKRKSWHRQKYVVPMGMKEERELWKERVGKSRIG
jgi:hypothetical protein